MYIKQVIIQGFRSYRDQVIIDPFSPKHNVIVGRNGSGKSNFFYAIQFVLSDEFSHMRQEERQALLHEGSGPRVISAFVEIIFDNSDNRLPIDREDVSLRRVIGSKKDQYFLDKKNVTKTDVMNLLESAGFSRSNPYYIVKQGKINQLATAKDHERLKLLREVAGTRVYDERKEESKQILNDTENKKTKIEELLTYIEERLETLQTEMEELKQYKKLDKDRRCIEYTIHEKELQTTRAKLEEFEKNRQDGMSQTTKLRKDAAEAADKIEEYTDVVRKLKDKLLDLNEQKAQLDEENRELIKTKTKLELDIKDSADAVNEFHSSKDAHEKELEDVRNRIQQGQSKLDELLPRFNRLKTTEEECTQRMAACEQRRSQLFSKQGRTNQFRSKEQRDEWINQELRSLTNAIATKQSQIHGLRAAVQKLNASKESTNNDMRERKEDLDRRKRLIDESNTKKYALTKKRDEQTNKRKELWRSEAELEQKLQNLTEDQHKRERTLRGSVSKAIFNGIESVKAVVRDEGIQGFYGPLIENFTCDKKFFTAVEVTAGNKLFHLVVDTDKTATNILKIMNDRKMPGSATFMPLNKLNARETQYPTHNDVFPMIRELHFDPKFRQAMLTVFGKTLMCRDIDVASQYSKSANLDCVTMEGDQVSRRGALTGGYYDTRKSRLDCQRSIQEVKAEIETFRAQHGEIREQLEQIDGVITGVLGELQRLESTLMDLKETYDRQKSDVKTKVKELENMDESLTQKNQLLSKMEGDLQAMISSQRSLSSELGTELMAHLSHEDQSEVDQINAEIQRLKEQMRSALSERSTLEPEKNHLENLLTNNLMKHRDKLLQELDEMAFQGDEKELSSKRDELASLESRNTTIVKRHQSVNKRVNEVSAQIKSNDEALEEWKNREKDARGRLEDDLKSVEKIANKKSVLVKKKDECMKKIRDLGSLPTDAFEKYQSTNVKALWKKLQKCNEELKKFSHVNKKALDQFVNFSEQKEKLMKRKDEVDKGYSAITELMEVLEHRKHEAILFTFKQVSYNFTAVFKELVPHGKANLVMKTEGPPNLDEESNLASSSQQSKDDGESSQSQSSSSQSQSKLPSDKFSGVSIKVSFTGKSAETREMNQLSGGQKSLVALALIFAIQRCDPAPFYLFDEIDQALDPQYRTSVAEMIRKQAEKAQFITTTFRAELLEASDKFYGVRFRNKVSHIDAITKEKAKEFVEDDERTA
ncbi:structural maintenance of chromosomes protein 3-like [Dendronephthya gigantea]|uniref:structural maintenance of chromosomes protein 3-like n=1 Tax=Dendronephthya gigantea TaxID=151771 RepID=UPI00106C7B2D|nr:structural maintenance of chromosomes protein 3-like [Dendronephthya gigantea]